MKKGSLAAFAELIPQTTRKKLNLSDLKVLSGALLVKDRIEQFYDSTYQAEARLRKWKRSEGYCGGRPYCMTLTGPDHFYCKSCLAEKARLLRGEGRKNKRSDYGSIRLKEKQQK